MGYLDLLRARYVVRLMLGTLVGRLPSGMAILAIPLTLRHAGASYGFVGLAAGVYGIAAAVGGPVLGRLVDRTGQPQVLVPTALAAGAGLVLIATLPSHHAAVLAGTVLAGAATPPLEPCLRVLWPSLVDPDRLEQAYAIDSGAQELIYVGAPLIVAGVAAVAVPASTLWVAAVIGLLGMLVVVTAQPARAYRAAERSTHWLGPLRSPGLLVLFAALVGSGTAVGGLNVLVVHYAEAHRTFGGAGGLLALNAFGALIGAIGYGAMRWSAPLERRALAAACGLALGYGLLPLVPGPAGMAALMVLTGLFLAPMLTVGFVLVDRLAPPGTVTEAFAWIVTVFGTGAAAGSALAGLLLDRSTPAWAASCGAFATAASVLIVLAGRRSLAESGDAPTGPEVPRQVPGSREPGHVIR